MGTFSDLKKSYVAVGPTRFWLMAAGTLALIATLSGLDIWLSQKTGWPEAYGFQCHGRGCTLTYLIHSPQLIHGGSIYELCLFALLWLLPAFLIGCGVYAIVRRIRRKSGA